MAESSDDGGARLVPDPTFATTQQLDRSVDAERAYVDGQIQVLQERLAGIDRATALRWPVVEGTPALIDEKVAQLAALMSERFNSVNKQLAIAEAQRIEQKADSAVGLTAALSAQKEAAAEQNKSNTLAISKSEAATATDIQKLAELFKSTTDAQASNHIDLKERVNAIESEKRGERTVVTDSRSSSALWVSVFVGFVAFAAVVVAIATAVKGP